MKTEDKDRNFDTDHQYFIDGHWWSVKFNPDEYRLDVVHDAGKCATCQARLPKTIAVEFVVVPDEESKLIHES